MSWIRVISYADSKGKLRKLYDRVKGPDNNVDNIMMAHSLRPHSMEGHMAIYKYVLHHNGNSLPKYFLEMLGTWVSMLNQCEYCVEHHFAGMKRLMAQMDNGAAKADTILTALKFNDLAHDIFTPADRAALYYARTLTLQPSTLTQKSIQPLHDAGYDDGEILEINQVSAYFSYANRTVLGLGVNTDGDVLGLSPNNSDNPDDWGHR